MSFFKNFSSPSRTSQRTGKAASKDSIVNGVARRAAGDYGGSAAGRRLKQVRYFEETVRLPRLHPDIIACAHSMSGRGAIAAAKSPVVALG